jgi:hypothetical protein
MICSSSLSFTAKASTMLFPSFYQVPFDDQLALFSQFGFDLMSAVRKSE